MCQRSHHRTEPLHFGKGSYCHGPYVTFRKQMRKDKALFACSGKTSLKVRMPSVSRGFFVVVILFLWCFFFMLQTLEWVRRKRKQERNVGNGG